MDKIIKALAKSRPFHNLSEETLKEITPLLKGNVKFFEKGALLLDERRICRLYRYSFKW